MRARFGKKFNHEGTKHTKDFTKSGQTGFVSSCRLRVIRAFLIIPLARLRLAQTEGEKDVLFFEKKNKKLFLIWFRALLMSVALAAQSARAKVFWFFFSKKNTSSFSPDCPVQGPT